MSGEFSFTWGMPILEGMGSGTPIARFMLDTYSSLGITRPEMLCLIHLASSGDDVSLSELAEDMGYGDRARVSELIRSLESKGMIVVTRRPGKPNEYDLSPFAKAALQRSKTVPASRRCQACQEEFPVLYRHHIIPKSKGGSDDPENIAMLCPNCHALAHLAREAE